jgi:hypothetical protein
MTLRFARHSIPLSKPPLARAGNRRVGATAAYRPRPSVPVPLVPRSGADNGRLALPVDYSYAIVALELADSSVASARKRPGLTAQRARVGCHRASPARLPTCASAQHPQPTRQEDQDAGSICLCLG